MERIASCYDRRKVSSPVCTVDAHGPNAVHALAFQVSHYTQR